MPAERSPRSKHERCRFASNTVVVTAAPGSDEDRRCRERARGFRSPTTTRKSTAMGPGILAKTVDSTGERNGLATLVESTAGRPLDKRLSLRLALLLPRLGSRAGVLACHMSPAPGLAGGRLLASAANGRHFDDPHRHGRRALHRSDRRPTAAVRRGSLSENQSRSQCVNGRRDNRCSRSRVGPFATMISARPSVSGRSARR